MKLAKKHIIPIAIAAIILLFPAKEKSIDGSLPRGIRNNNPGNIKISSSNWVGKIPVSQNTDGVFEQFTALVYGVRAMIKLIQNYIAQGDNTISRIISRYAPSSENATENYIRYVSEQTGINRNAKISNHNLYPVIEAMAKMENGTGMGTIIPYSEYIKALQI